MPNMPNLVFIFSDRQRYDTLSAYSNDWIQTPNLNDLAKQSIVFENCYVTQPVCAPARSSIMTGLYPHAAGVPRNKISMPTSIQTIAQMVTDDYQKGYFGKWHLGNDTERQRGFDDWISVVDDLWSMSNKSHKTSNYHKFLVDKGFEPDNNTPHGKIFSGEMRANLPAEYQISSFLSEQAKHFIHRNSKNPFVLYVSMIEPHPPFTGPYNHLYDPELLPVDPSFLKPPIGHSLFNRLRSEYFMKGEFDGHDLSSELGWRRLRSNYMANITLVDDAVGKILQAIDDSGQSSNTIVVFTSEHGDMVGSHAMLEMRTFYEAASRVPFLIKVPWLNNGSRKISGNFGQIDLVPTLLDLMEQTVPGHIQGTSRLDVLKGQSTLENNDIFIQHNGIGDRDLTSEESRQTASQDLRENINFLNTLPWRSIVTSERWKLNLCASDQCELFDLNSDPNEFDNLFDNPDQKDRIRIMGSKIMLWQHQTGDIAPLPSL